MGDFNLRDRGRSNDEKLLSRTSGHFNHLIAGNIVDATVACLCTLIKLLKKTKESNRRSNAFKMKPVFAGGWRGTGRIRAIAQLEIITFAAVTAARIC